MRAAGNHVFQTEKKVITGQASICQKYFVISGHHKGFYWS